MNKLYCILICLVAIISCKPGIPADVLSEGTMVDILYDMHVAQAMADNGNILQNSKEIIALRSSVLQKHDVTQEEWDASYNFYCSHAEYMYEVYQDLSERMQQNVVAVGGKIAGVEEEAADTANVWNQPSSAILFAQAPYNKLDFSILPDSTFNFGDRISLQFDTQMIFKDGMRDVTACLNVFYENDSVGTRVNHINTDGRNVLMISPDSLMVRKITGFFQLTQNITDDTSNDYVSTLRVASLRHIKLLHLQK